MHDKLCMTNLAIDVRNGQIIRGARRIRAWYDPSSTAFPVPDPSIDVTVALYLFMPAHRSPTEARILETTILSIGVITDDLSLSMLFAIIKFSSPSTRPRT